MCKCRDNMSSGGDDSGNSSLSLVVANFMCQTVWGTSQNKVHKDLDEFVQSSQVPPHQSSDLDLMTTVSQDNISV